MNNQRTLSRIAIVNIGHQTSWLAERILKKHPALRVMTINDQYSSIEIIKLVEAYNLIILVLDCRNTADCRDYILFSDIVMKLDIKSIGCLLNTENEDACISMAFSDIKSIKLATNSYYEIPCLCDEASLDLNISGIAHRELFNFIDTLIDIVTKPGLMELDCDDIDNIKGKIVLSQSTKYAAFNLYEHTVCALKKQHFSGFRPDQSSLIFVVILGRRPICLSDIGLINDAIDKVYAGYHGMQMIAAVNDGLYLSPLSIRVITARW